MDTDSYFRTLTVDIELDVIDNINKFIDESGHRNSPHQVFENKEFSLKYINKDFVNAQKFTNSYGGPGRNKGSYLALPEHIYKNSNIEKIKNVLNLSYFAEPFIFKMVPNYFFSWHIDATRQAGVNIPLSDYGYSATLISTENHENDDICRGQRSTDIVKVNYQLGKASILNTQKFHCVFNVEPVNRFLLVFLMYPPKENYFQVCEFLKSHDLL